FIQAINHTGMDERGRKTLERMKRIEKALVAYQDTYGRLPPTDNRRMMATLTGHDMSGMNPEHIKFFEFVPPHFDREGRRWPGNIAEDGFVYDFYAKPLTFKRVTWSTGDYVAMVSAGERLDRSDDNIIWAVKVME
ncbi:MAG: hypothetical protein AAF492_01340, partial [Verrucomicrobiota bacterium]